jgi:hypothetical protein
MASRMPTGLCLVVLLGGCKFIEKPKPTVNVDVTFLTQYNHRGMVQNENPVMQPSLNLAVPDDVGGTIGVGVFGNLNLTNSAGDAWQPTGQGGRFSEIDLTGRYSHNIVGPVDATAGVVSYVLPSGTQFLRGTVIRGTTSEAFIESGANLFKGSLFSFRPLVRFNYDVDEVNGYYVQGGLSKGVPLAFLIDGLRFEVRGMVGYSDEKHAEWTYGLKEDGFSDFLGTGAFSYALTDKITITAGVSGASIIDRDLRDWFDIIRIEKDNVWGFVGLGWTL